MDKTTTEQERRIRKRIKAEITNSASFSIDDLTSLFIRILRDEIKNKK